MEEGENRQRGSRRWTVEEMKIELMEGLGEEEAEMEMDEGEDGRRRSRRQRWWRR